MHLTHPHPTGAPEGRPSPHLPLPAVPHSPVLDRLPRPPCVHDNLHFLRALPLASMLALAASSCTLPTPSHSPDPARCHFSGLGSAVTSSRKSSLTPRVWVRWTYQGAPQWLYPH